MIRFDKNKLRELVEFLAEDYERITRQSINVEKWETNLLKAGFQSSVEENKGYVRKLTYPLEVRICPEPVNLLPLFKDCKTAVEAREKFKEVIYPRISPYSIKKQPVGINNNPVWYNSAHVGVNIRTGFQDGDIDSPFPVALTSDSDVVHAKMGGATGGGKSVALNQIIMTMLMEYPPWELEMWLADFKRVEFGMYGTNAHAPHLKTIAITGMVDYVLSLLERMVHRMEGREKFFKLFGVKNLAEFREVSGTILPRVIFIVDEFQQLFLAARGPQSNAIDKVFTAVVKKGRSSGYHLFLASQSLKGTISGDLLNNFKCSLCVKAPADVSSAIVGNDAASKFVGLGNLVINASGGKQEDNLYYKVPFSSNEEIISRLESYFNIAQSIPELKKRMYEKFPVKVFDDEQYTGLEGFYEQMKHKYEINDDKDKSGYEDTFVIGDSCVFKEEFHDFETISLFKDRKYGILCVAMDNYWVAKFMRLIALNLKDNKNAEHILLSNVIGIEKDYDLTTDLTVKTVVKNKTIPDRIQSVYSLRENYVSYFDLKGSEFDLKTFSKALTIAGALESDSVLTQLVSEYSDKSKEELFALDMGGEDEKEVTVYEIKFYWEDYMATVDRSDGQSLISGMHPKYVWVIGPELYELGPRDADSFGKFMIEGPKLGIFFIVISKSIDSPMFYSYKDLKHVLLKTNEDKVFTRFSLERPKEWTDGIYLYYNQNTYEDTLVKSYDGLVEYDTKVDFESIGLSDEAM